MRRRLARFPKRISLAVVGAQTSGKSFLIRDICEALRFMRFAPYDSPSLKARLGFTPRPLSDYQENETSGGSGGTALYAYRHDKHYGQLVKHADRDDFDFDFLNIPGEIFVDAHMRVFNALKQSLNTPNSLFQVFTYENMAGDKKPNSGSFQRASASTPQSFPFSAHTTG